MNNPHNIPPIDQLPGVFRITDISATPMMNGRGIEYQVKIFNERASMTVSYTRSQPDIRLKADMLVSVRWKLPVNSVDGAIQISRLVLLEQPIKGTNLFETVPYGWVKDRDLVKRAKTVMDALPDNLNHLIVSILWHGTRFRHFCNRPASMNGHHSNVNGNLLHTTEVAETVMLNAVRYPKANLGISLAAAILHDVGKADEYNQWNNGTWNMTDRGKLVGHRHTVIEWISAAMATNRIAIQDKHYLSLLHALTAAPGAEWIGIRAPATPEATLLTVADKLSGESSLATMLANQKGGWGTKHPHRKGNLYTLPADSMNSF